MIRRATGTPEATRLAVGDLTVDLLVKEVMWSGQKIEFNQPATIRNTTCVAYFLHSPTEPSACRLALSHKVVDNFAPVRIAPDDKTGIRKNL